MFVEYITQLNQPEKLGFFTLSLGFLPLVIYSHLVMDILSVVVDRIISTTTLPHKLTSKMLKDFINTGLEIYVRVYSSSSKYRVAYTFRLDPTSGIPTYQLWWVYTMWKLGLCPKEKLVTLKMPKKIWEEDKPLVCNHISKT